MYSAAEDAVAEVMAAMDGWAKHEVGPHYYTEAKEVVRQLNERGFDVVRINGDDN